MEIREVFEILGRTYAQMYKISEREGEPEKENEMLKEVIRKYENVDRDNEN